MKLHIFNQTVDFLWNHRCFYLDYPEDYVFDYPNYGNLPQKLTNSFSPEVVDAIQELWQDSFVVCQSSGRTVINTKRDFRAAFKFNLKNLGEQIQTSYAP